MRTFGQADSQRFRDLGNEGFWASEGFWAGIRQPFTSALKSSPPAGDRFKILPFESKFRNHGRPALMTLRACGADGILARRRLLLALAVHEFLRAVTRVLPV